MELLDYFRDKKKTLDFKHEKTRDRFKEWISLGNVPKIKETLKDLKRIQRKIAIFHEDVRQYLPISEQYEFIN